MKKQSSARPSSASVREELRRYLERKKNRLATKSVKSINPIDQTEQKMDEQNEKGTGTGRGSTKGKESREKMTAWKVPHFGIHTQSPSDEEDASSSSSVSDDEKEDQERSAQDDLRHPYLQERNKPSPLFTVDLSKSVGSEYAGMIEDMIRMVSLQLTIQVMLYFGNATDTIFSEDLFVLLFYIILGVAFFWLVVKTLVSFK